MHASASASPPRTIVILATQLGGGIGRVLDHLVHAFDNDGIDVHVLLSKDWGHFVDSARRHSDVRRLGTTHAWLGVPGLVRHLRRIRPDAIITDTPRLTHLAVRSVSRVRPRPSVIAVAHNTYSVKFRELPDDKRARRVRRMRRLYPEAEHIVAVSSGVADDLSTYLGIERSRITVIHNPILPPGGIRLDPDVEPLEDYREADVPIVVGMGRLCAAKDFDTLIRAFSLVRESVLARLVIFGDGEGRASLQRTIEQLGLGDVVHLPGHTNHAYEALAGADVFVMSSRWEGFGNVLAEALAVGTPVVSTDCPHGPAEILDGGRYGRMVPMGNPVDMATAIVSTLAEASEPGELQQAAQRFSSEKSAREYIALLDRKHGQPNRDSATTGAMEGS